MYKIKVKSSFSSAHSLRNYKGKCEGLHGHNWEVLATLSNKSLAPSGMIMDFSEFKKILISVLDALDHKHLNDLEYFKHQNPSSEEIAKYIFNCLKEKLPKKGERLEEVSVWETENSCATYHE